MNGKDWGSLPDAYGIHDKWNPGKQDGCGPPEGLVARDGKGGGSRPISRVLSWTAIPLGVPLPARSSSLPGSDASSANASLFGLAPDGVYRAVRVAASAVSSYLAVSPLPDPDACAAGHRRSALCCTFRRLRLAAYSARPLAGILLCGARTFLPALDAPGGCLDDFPDADYTRPPSFAARLFVRDGRAQRLRTACAPTTALSA